MNEYGLKMTSSELMVKDLPGNATVFVGVVNALNVMMTWGTIDPVSIATSAQQVGKELMGIEITPYTQDELDQKQADAEQKAAEQQQAEREAQIAMKTATTPTTETPAKDEPPIA